LFRIFLNCAYSLVHIPGTIANIPVVCGIAYLSLGLIAIIAIANHYWLDTIAVTVVAFTTFLCNRVFMVLLSLEDVLSWVLRLEKPTSTPGDSLHQGNPFQ